MIVMEFISFIIVMITVWGIIGSLISSAQLFKNKETTTLESEPLEEVEPNTTIHSQQSNLKNKKDQSTKDVRQINIEKTEQEPRSSAPLTHPKYSNKIREQSKPLEVERIRPHKTNSKKPKLTKETLRSAVIYQEILDRPKAFRK